MFTVTFQAVPVLISLQQMKSSWKYIYNVQNNLSFFYQPGMMSWFRGFHTIHKESYSGTWTHLVVIHYWILYDAWAFFLLCFFWVVLFIQLKGNVDFFPVVVMLHCNWNYCNKESFKFVSLWACSILGNHACLAFHFSLASPPPNPEVDFPYFVISRKMLMSIWPYKILAALSDLPEDSFEQHWSFR